MISWLHRLLRRRRLDAEIRAEMEFHLEQRARDLAAQHGLDPSQAARRARLEFGSLEAWREEARDAFGLRLASELAADFRFAARSFRKSPVFTFAAVTILALAIAANSAFFTIYGNYALKSLPIRAPERHFELAARTSQAHRLGNWAPGELAALRHVAPHEIEGIYSASGLLQVLVIAPVQRPAMALAVSASYFPLLGGHAMLGRTLSQDDEQKPVAVLSHAGFTRLFPNHASPLGQSVRVRSTWFTVIGVMPPGFTGVEAAVPDLWVGAGMRHALRDGIGQRQRAALFLRPGVSPTRAEAALTAVASHFHRPSDEAIARVELRPRSTYFGQEDGTPILAALLFSIFLLVLLIACANLANLFLARMASRSQEIAMRFALGAGRFRIVRQLLTEAAMLALLGASAGLALGTAALASFHDWLFSYAAQAGASVLPLTLDWRVFAFSAALALLAAAAFGLLPALDVTALRPRRARPLRNLLLGSQVAASAVLLILAALLVRNLAGLHQVHPGYSLDRTFDLQLDPPRAPLLATLRAHPSVRAASAAARIPLYGSTDRIAAVIDGRSLSLACNHVDDHYFDALDVALRSGRPFHRAETANSARVAIVSESTARTLWPGASPLGRTISIGGPLYEIVGVAPDLIHGWIFEGPEPLFLYLPTAAGRPEATSTLIRLRDSHPATLAAIRALCASSPDSSGCDPKSLRDLAAMQRFPFHVAATMAAGLGALALLLTAIGLYSVVSYSVERRRREIGLLVALGAEPSQVTRRILGEAARCFAAGLAAGLPVCFALSALAASSVLRIRTFDPAAYLGVPALLAVTAGLACLIPLRRALRVQPMAALRQD